MKTITPWKTYEFEVIEKRTYTIQGDGRTDFEARQDAIERFHRLTKSGELTASVVSKPVITKTIVGRK
jgi:hypothetical protein